MQRNALVALCVALAAIFACGQQVNPSASQPQADAQQERVKVYSVGPGVTAPALLPLNLAPPPTEKCGKKLDGTVELSLLVDATGHPRNIMFLHPLGTDVDRFALHIAGADRFTPGAIDGKPVVVAQSLHIKIQSCLIESKGSTGNKKYSLTLRSAPMQELRFLPNPPEDAVLSQENSSWKDSDGNTAHLYKIGGAVSAPIPLIQPEAEFSEEARGKKISGSCWFSLIVDAQGMPQNVQETQQSGYGLDEKAFAALAKYRFKPAMKNGEPVAVNIKIEINFKTW